MSTLKLVLVGVTLEDNGVMARCHGDVRKRKRASISADSALKMRSLVKSRTAERVRLFVLLIVFATYESGTATERDVTGRLNIRIKFYRHGLRSIRNIERLR